MLQLLLLLCDGQRWESVIATATAVALMAAPPSSRPLLRRLFQLVVMVAMGLAALPVATMIDHVGFRRTYVILIYVNAAALPLFLLGISRRPRR